MGWGGGGVVAHEILVSAQGPLVLGFWVLGLSVWGLGLTIKECQTVPTLLSSKIIGE